MKDFQTLQALKAMRDNAAASDQERETAGRILRERLTKAGIREEELDKEQPRAVPFIVPSGKEAQRIWLRVACWITQQNPLPVESGRKAGRGLEEWTLKVTISQEMDITDAARHYLAILGREMEAIALRRKDVQAQYRRLVKELTEDRDRRLRNLDTEREALPIAIISRYDMPVPDNGKKKRDLTPEEYLAALAAAKRLPDDEWRRKLKGDGPRALGNGGGEPFRLE